MSDEERDVDIESEDDDGASSAATQFMTQAEKRAHHNALERKRRDHIKESFSGLRDSIPSSNGEKSSVKVSRAQILKKASDYIQFMRRKNHSHQIDIDELKKTNYLLDQQVRQLEKTRQPANNSTNSTSVLNAKGGAISAFDGGSDSESSGPGSLEDGQPKRKKIKS